MGSGKEKRKLCKIIFRRKGGQSFVIVAFVLVVVVGCQILENVEAATGDLEGGKETAAENNMTKVSDVQPAPVPQVRYRNRPVAAFRSNSSTKPSNGSSNSNESNVVGVPSFAVHDLTSQTFEKLHENWRNLETFLRNLQTRRSQEESLRSSSQRPHLPEGTNSRENFGRLPQYPNGNVYSLRYHPILEGQGVSNANGDDAGKGQSPRNHFNFNPYPYDPKGQGHKDIDMERHTLATVYTIGICLTIMAIGSVMFILINKCDGTNGSSYTRDTGPSRQISMRAMQTRIARGMMDAMGVNGASARPAPGRQGRTRRGRSGGGGGSSNNNNDPTSGGVLSEIDAKILTDLPPSYDSLFPEGGPNLKVSVQPEPSTSTMTTTRTASETNNVNLSSNNSDLNNHTSSSNSNNNVSNT